MVFAAVGLGAGIPLALGLLVVCWSSQRVIGWLLVAHGVSVGLLLGGWQNWAGVSAALMLDQLAQGSWVFLFLWLVLVAYLVPDGRLPSRRWRRWVWAGLTGVVLFLAGAAGDVDSFRQEHNGLAPPLRWLPAGVSEVLGVVGLALVVCLF